jgi:heme-degrading monooxygenase HmoA
MKAGQDSRYFNIAAELRPALEKQDGFISIERFQSTVTSNKFLSLSLWRDEDAVANWRAHKEHQQAQMLGKSEIFEDFRIIIAEAVRDYTMKDRVLG